MKLSIIIATYNRKQELQALLDSLAQQTIPADAFEVVIVDDGSTDGTESFIQGYRSTSPLHINYYNQENRGPGYARNLGMSNATGDVFIFIDSDCIAPPEYLERVRRAFTERNIDAFGGPDRAAGYFSVWDKAVNYTMTSFLTTGGLRGRAGKKLAKYHPRSFNMGLRREVFETIGGFGSIYHYGEDIEFSHRILKSGAKVEYLPDAYVYHRRRSSPVTFARQVWKMGKARIRLGRIDPELLEPLHFLPSAGVAFMVVALLTAAVYPPAREPVYMLVVIAGIFLLLIGLHGAVKTKHPASIVVIPFALLIQISMYGTGLLRESMSRNAGTD